VTAEHSSRSEIYEENGRLHTVKELNTQAIIELIENYLSNWKNHIPCYVPVKNPILLSPLPTGRTTMFGKNFQTLAKDCNKPLGLRLIMVINMMMIILGFVSGIDCLV
jgi:hypothetical protein